MAGTYAQQTQVSTDRSMGEIRKTLGRYGASQYAYLEAADHAAVAFVYQGYQVQFVVPLPNRNDRDFTHSPQGRRRVETTAESAYEQAVRQRWRALALVIKAKLEAVQAGIVTFEQEFAMHMVLPGGQRVDEAVINAIGEAYQSSGPMRLQIGDGRAAQ